MRRPRVWSEIIEGKVIGRLVANYDSAEQTMEFEVPSTSRKRVYVVRVDARTTECCCSCEALKDFRNAASMPYRDIAAGTMLEQMCRMRGINWLPCITRPPRALCPHARLVRRWLQRHGILKPLEEIERLLIEDLESRKTA